MNYTLLIADYTANAWTTITKNLTVAPSVGNAVEHSGQYYLFCHKVINQTDTWIVQPFMFSPVAP